MLRTRILLIAMAILLLVIGLFTYGAWLRDRLGQAERDALRLDGLAQSWHQHGNAVLERVTAVIEAQIAATGAIEAIGDRDSGLLNALYRDLAEDLADDASLVRIDLYATDGNLLFSTDPSYLALHLLGEGEPLPLQADERLFGSRVVGDSLRGVAVVPLHDDQVPDDDDGAASRIGTLAVILDLAQELQVMARERDAAILVLNRAGAPVLATGSLLGGAVAPSDAALVPADWLAILPDGFDQTNPTLEEVATEDGRFELASVLAVDVGGGRSATLVLARDISRLAEQRRFADLAWLLGAVLLGMGPLLLLWVYLRRAFEPLDEAVDALRQLADGRTDHYAELSSGEDEIGDIGRAIEVFRQNALALERNADLEERRRRRQARFIRRQMTTLSETLDEAAQASAMADLQQIEAAADAHGGGDGDSGSGDAGGSRFSDQLGLIGVALERMTARVKSQQQALSELIDELREALEMKTRLISLEQELDIARQMQQNVLPRTFPATPGFEIAAMMQPAREVGGDFYDIFQVDAHRVGVAIADVSGKGIPAAFFMLIARTLLKAMALEGGGPGKTLARLNDFLCGDNEETMFVTLFYGELDSRSGRFTYANGGHNHPFIVADGAPPLPLPTTEGVALAVFDQLSFAEHTVTLAQGQTLVLYTDGVTEAFDEEGQMFGEARLATLLATTVADAGSGTAEAVLQAILGSLEAFCTDVAQSDDITLIVIAGRDPAATLPFPAPGTGEGGKTAPTPSNRPASHAA